MSLHKLARHHVEHAAIIERKVCYHDVVHSHEQPGHQCHRESDDVDTVLKMHGGRGRAANGDGAEHVLVLCSPHVPYGVRTRITAMGSSYVIRQRLVATR